MYNIIRTGSHLPDDGVVLAEDELVGRRLGVLPGHLARSKLSLPLSSSPFRSLFLSLSHLVRGGGSAGTRLAGERGTERETGEHGRCRESMAAFRRKWHLEGEHGIGGRIWQLSGGITCIFRKNTAAFGRL